MCEYYSLTAGGLPRVMHLITTILAATGYSGYILAPTVREPCFGSAEAPSEQDVVGYGVPRTPLPRFI
jgi:hypothetical protein